MSFVVGDRVRFEPQDFCEGRGREGTIKGPYQATRGLRWLVVWDIPQKKTHHYTAVNLALLNENEYEEDLV